MLELLLIVFDYLALTVNYLGIIYNGIYTSVIHACFIFNLKF